MRRSKWPATHRASSVRPRRALRALHAWAGGPGSHRSAGTPPVRRPRQPPWPRERTTYPTGRGAPRSRWVLRAVVAERQDTRRSPDRPVPTHARRRPDGRTRPRLRPTHGQVRRCSALSERQPVRSRLRRQRHTLRTAGHGSSPSRWEVSPAHRRPQHL